MGTSKTMGTIVAIIGVLMIVAGAATYYMVYSELASENITVAEDADFLAGDEVDGPFSAYAEAQIIGKHAEESTGGLTYAELDREDPLREVAMNASFLRASLFTSVVAFGVAVMAMGVGLAFVLTGMGLVAAGRAVRVDDRHPARA